MQVVSHAFDRVRVDGAHGSAAFPGWLLDVRDGIRPQPAPDDRSTERALEHDECLADRLLAYTFCTQLGRERLDQLGSQLAQLERTETRQHMLVQDGGVEPLRVLLEVLARVSKPPLFDEVGECLLAGVEVVEVALGVS